MIYFLICYAAGEMMSVAEPFLEQNMHPTVIIKAYRQAMDDLVEILRDMIRYKHMHQACNLIPVHYSYLGQLS